MKKFIAVYIGSTDGKTFEDWKANPNKAEIEKKGMDAWMEWGMKQGGKILDNGGSLGKTKRIDKSGVSDTKNLLTGYTIVEAESHEEAAKMFLDHPHFSIFPGESVEIMEIMPMPEMK